MIIAQIFPEHASQVTFVPNDDVIEAISSNGSVQSLDVWVLPRTAVTRENFLDAQGFYPSSKGPPLNTVAVPQEISRSLLPIEGVHRLLGRPLCSRMLSNAEMENQAAMMLYQDEYIEQSEGDGRHDEEVDRNNSLSLMMQEGAPSLRRTLSPVLRHQVRNRAFGDLDAELQ